jgi:hypothetical protein
VNGLDAAFGSFLVRKLSAFLRLIDRRILAVPLAMHWFGSTPAECAMAPIGRNPLPDSSPHSLAVGRLCMTVLARRHRGVAKNQENARILSYGLKHNAEGC